MDGGGRKEVFPLLCSAWCPVSLLDAGDPAKVKMTTKSGPLVLSGMRTGIDEPTNVPRGERKGSGLIGGERERGEGGECAPLTETSPGGGGGRLGAMAADPETPPGPEDGGREGNSFPNEMTAERIGGPTPLLGVSSLHSEVVGGPT